jgi:carbon-monoxide dehydrogenase small subunit
MTAVNLTVNGEAISAEVTPRTHLADFLREHLLLTGTHIGCEHGICGACTVEIDGEIARSCITYAVACDGAKVRTIEGFDDDRLMARLRRAFSEAHALQCGYCTPGMLLAARDLIRRKGALTRDQIRTEMSGNLCRCTGYVGIVNAVERVMAERGEFDLASAAAQQPGLGPAPGPEASSTVIAKAPLPSAASPREARDVTRAGVPRSSKARPATKRQRIKVEVGTPEEVDGATRLTQSFELDHPRDAVWRLMADARAVASCIPGMMLDAPHEDGRVTGRMEIGLGPITASFAGEGTVSSFPAEYRQMITGRGADRKSGSNASGEVAYRLHEMAGPTGEKVTRVDVEMSYALTGPLAQFGRSNLVRDLVSRVGESFAQNLDARLSAPEGVEIVPARLGAVSLVWRLILGRVRDGVTRLFSKQS